MQNEQHARFKIDTILANKGWEERLLHYEYRTKNNKRADYVLDHPDKPNKKLAVIEAKRKLINNSDINKAIEQASSYAEQINAPVVYITDGIFWKSWHVKEKQHLIFNGEEVDYLLPPHILINYLDSHNHSVYEEELILNRHELINIFRNINNKLRGVGIGAGSMRLYQFCNILFLKLLSEKKAEWQKIWDQLEGMEGKDLIDSLGKYLLDGLRLEKDISIIDDRLIKNPGVLLELIEMLSPLKFTNTNTDVKGDAFEYFIRESNKRTRGHNDLGEYFTPRHIVKLLVKLANPNIGDVIYDPFCGTGGILIYSYKYIYDNMKITPDNEKQLSSKSLFGNEITEVSRIAKMNMVLAGDGSSNVEQENSLSFGNKRRKEEFDFVITNIPFNLKLKNIETAIEEYQDGNAKCIKHCIDSVKEKGKAVIIVPDDVMYKENKDTTNIRREILKSGHLEEIVNLPGGVFAPYATAKTSILVFNKTGHSTSKKTWVFDVENDGFTLDSYRKKIEGENDIDRFLRFRGADDKTKEENGFYTITPPPPPPHHIFKRRTVFSGKAKDAKLSQICSLVQGEDIAIEPDKKYSLPTVRYKNQGLILREEKLGKNIGVKKQKRGYAGLIVVAKHGMHDGAYAVIGEEQGTYIYTNSFFFLGINDSWRDKITPQQLCIILGTNPYKERFAQMVQGVTQRRTIPVETFMETPIPMATDKALLRIVSNIHEDTLEIDKTKKRMAKNTVELEDKIHKYGDI